MASKKWTREEELQMVTLYSSGNNFNIIGEKLGRSPNAIKLRIESIVYDNLVKNKSPASLAKTLGTSKDNIIQFYYSHKSFKESKGEPVIDINILKQSCPSPKRQMGGEPSDHMHMHNTHNVTDKVTDKINEISSNIGGSTTTEILQTKLNNIELENKILEAMVKNYEMKKHLKKLYIDGKLDAKSANTFGNMLAGQDKLI